MKCKVEGCKRKGYKNKKGYCYIHYEVFLEKANKYYKEMFKDENPRR